MDIRFDETIVDGAGGIVLRQPRFWTTETLRPLPTLYCLAGHGIVRIRPEVDNVSVEIISDRAAEFFRLYSIAVRLDESSSGRVVGTTTSGVQCSIQLWRSTRNEVDLHDNREPSPNSSMTVIVHIQRMSGDNYSFVRTRRNFLEAIQTGNMGIARQEDDPSTAPTYNLDREEGDIGRQLPHLDRNVFLYDNDPYRMTGICHQLLHNPTEQYCGLKILSVMTDISSTLLSEVDGISRFVLTDAGIQQILMGHLVGYSDGSTPMMFHLLTLRILAQSLEHMPNLRLRRTTVDWNSPFWQVSLNIFHQHVNENHTKPLEASLSIRCLRAIHRWSSTLTDMLPMPTEATLWAAYHEGRQCHSMLEQESKSFLEEMGVLVV